MNRLVLTNQGSTLIRSQDWLNRGFEVSIAEANDLTALEDYEIVPRKCANRREFLLKLHSLSTSKIELRSNLAAGGHISALMSSP